MRDGEVEPLNILCTIIFACTATPACTATRCDGPLLGNSWPPQLNSDAISMFWFIKYIQCNFWGLTVPLQHLLVWARTRIGGTWTMLELSFCLHSCSYDFNVCLCVSCRSLASNRSIVNSNAVAALSGSAAGAGSSSIRLTRRQWHGDVLWTQAGAQHCRVRQPAGH